MNDLVVYLAWLLIGVMFVSCAWSEHQEELRTTRAGARGLMVDQLDGLHGKRLIKIHVDGYEYWSIGDYFKRFNC